MNKMGTKAYQVANLLIDHPDEWYTAQDMSWEINLTSRQVISAISMMNFDWLKKSPSSDGKRMRFMFDSTVADRAEAKRTVVRMRYGITEEMMRMAHGTLSSAAWASASDVSGMLGISVTNASHILSAMDGVQVKYLSTTTLYRRND